MNENVFIIHYSKLGSFAANLSVNVIRVPRAAVSIHTAMTKLIHQNITRQSVHGPPHQIQRFDKAPITKLRLRNEMEHPTDSFHYAFHLTMIPIPQLTPESAMYLNTNQFCKGRIPAQYAYPADMSCRESGCAG